ncbi:hypothetical protein [Eoetvoesiella caeni]
MPQECKPTEPSSQEPAQEQTQSYPGIKGPKARELQKSRPIDIDAAAKEERDAEKLEGIPKTLEKSKESRNDQ